MKVVHCKKDAHDVYIGRPSIWGNPYTHLANAHLAEFKVATREEAISKYRIWLTDKVHSDPIFREELLKLDGKTLGCWCKPQSCHGDVIVEIINMIKLGVI